MCIICGMSVNSFSLLCYALVPFSRMFDKAGALLLRISLYSAPEKEFSGFAGYFRIRPKNARSSRNSGPFRIRELISWIEKNEKGVRGWKNGEITFCVPAFPE